jgi:hypothetical protein
MSNRYYMMDDGRWIIRDHEPPSRRRRLSTWACFRAVTGVDISDQAAYNRPVMHHNSLM